MSIKNSKCIVLLCIISLSFVTAPVQAGSREWGYAKYVLTFCSGWAAVGGTIALVEIGSLIPEEKTSLSLSAIAWGFIGSYITCLLYHSAAQEFEDVKREDAKILAEAFLAAQIEAQRQQP